MKGKNFSCNNATGNRKKSDFYATPYSLTEQLLPKEALLGTILEPACGDGAIVKVLNNYGYTSESYDIEKNFLNETRTFGTIITNPPFSLAMQFILHAKKVATNKIAFLLPLSYLHGKKRFDDVYSDKIFPLKKVYVFTRYPMLGDPLRPDGKYRTGMMVYSWFVWDKTYNGNPEIDWLDNNKYVISKKDL